MELQLQHKGGIFNTRATNITVNAVSLPKEVALVCTSNNLITFWIAT